MNEKMSIINNKRSQSELLAIALMSALILTTSVVLANSSAVNFNSVEKTGDINVFANTSIILEIIQNNVRALLNLDNQTAIPEKEIEFYLDNELINKNTTDSKGYSEYSFNYCNKSPGIYFFNAKFQGSSSDYFSASESGKQIEIIEENGTREVKIIEKIPLQINQTQNNETLSLLSIKTNKINYIINETIIISGEAIINGEKINDVINLEIIFNDTKIFTSDINVTDGSYSYSLIADFENEGEYVARISLANLSAETQFYLFANESIIDLGNMICKEFEDYVLWTSGFTNSPKGSTNYQTWIPETNCTQAGGENCFLQDISVSSRTIYVTSSGTEINGKSYIQISNPDKSICDNSENGVYSKYLAFEAIKGFEGQKKGWYCGYDKEESEDLIKSEPKCGIKLNEKFTSEVECYGIKVYASQDTMIDVFNIRYKWCWGQSYGDNYEIIKKKENRR